MTDKNIAVLEIGNKIVKTGSDKALVIENFEQAKLSKTDSRGVTATFECGEVIPLNHTANQTTERKANLEQIKQRVRRKVDLIVNERGCQSGKQIVHNGGLEYRPPREFIFYFQSTADFDCANSSQKQSVIDALKPLIRQKTGLKNIRSFTQRINYSTKSWWIRV